MIIDPSSIAIAATTFYPKWYRGRLRSIAHTNKVRGDLALEFVRKACNLGYSIVVVDGKSSKSFRSTISKIRGARVVKARGLKRAPKKRQAIKLASKIPSVRVILLTEAEKISLLTDCMGLIVEPIIKNKTDIVIPKRVEELFRSTYPDYQYESEVEGNKLYNEALRSKNLLPLNEEDLDMFFGPRVFKNDPKILALFMKQHNFKIGNTAFSSEYFDPEQHSNILYFPIVEALKKGIRVKSVVVPFLYPPIQKKNEEKGARELFLEKRKSQRLSLLLGLIRFLGVLDGISKHRKKVFSPK